MASNSVTLTILGTRENLHHFILKTSYVMLNISQQISKSSSQESLVSSSRRILFESHKRFHLVRVSNTIQEQGVWSRILPLLSLFGLIQPKHQLHGQSKRNSRLLSFFIYFIGSVLLVEYNRHNTKHSTGDTSSTN